MSSRSRLLLLLALIIAPASAVLAAVAGAAKPNIVFIPAADWGWGDQPRKKGAKWDVDL